MKRFGVCILALAYSLSLLAGCGASPTEQGSQPPSQQVSEPPAQQAVADPTDDNYRVFYQIFVGSFSDSDGDGLGDLRGIINRLDYLNDGDINSGNDLGVQGIWLSPIFQSPSYHKYDVQDYYSVDSRFGTMEDLKELLDLCHQRNVKVILDLVLNHTSSRNRWFNDFRSAHQQGNTDSPYYDFYSWCTEEERPNGSWQPVGNSGHYYEGNFSPDMPELNYDNPAVRERMLEVAKTYLDMGVDGFRFDAVKYLYYGETSRNVDFWKWYMDELRACKSDIYCVGECWSGEGEVLEYYSAMNCFNFAASQAEGHIATAAKGGDINNFTHYVCSYQEKTAGANPDAMPILFLSNHDMDRSSGYLMLANGFPYVGASLMLLSPGSPFVYYGEEIAAKGSRGGDNTDANRRLAMLWGDGDTVRDPEGTTYDSAKQTNGTVASQLKDENSLLSHYRRLIALRVKYPAIARGTYTQLNLGDTKVGGFTVEYQDSTLGIVHNVSRDREITVELTGTGYTQLLEIVGRGTATLEGNVLTLSAQTSVILGGDA